MKQRETPQQRRTLAVLFAAQVLSGAGLAAGITVAALLAADMLGSAAWAGLPTAFFTFGSAGAAVSVGRISQRFGRRAGLTLGYLAGAIGSAGVVAAAVIDNVPLLFVSLFIYGAGFATNLQARYAGGDLASPGRQGTAVSIVLVATAFGAVAGPNLVTVTGHIAEQWGIPALAGPFVLATAVYVLAAIVLWAFLRPDPLLLARQLAIKKAADNPQADQSGQVEPADRRSVWLAASVMMLTQLVMVAIMTITPVHMIAHGHTLSAAAMVISIHVGFMFFPSLLSGCLVDRYGARPIAGAAGVVMLAAGLLAALANDQTVPLAIALALLGLGWSFGLVSGTAMLTQAVPLASRAKTQGLVDLGIALAGAGGGLGSGFAAAAAGYSALALAGGLIALVIVPLAAAATSSAAKAGLD